MSPDVTCSCGHRWETRKPLSEIDQLRCSNCNTASEDDLTIADEQEDEVHDHPEILTSVETSATREELTERVGDLVARMEKAAPPDSLAPTEVKDTYRRLSELHHKLRDEEVSMGLDELETVEDYVDGCIDNIDEHLADIEEVLSLKSQVSDIREKKRIV